MYVIKCALVLCVLGFIGYICLEMSMQGIPIMVYLWSTHYTSVAEHTSIDIYISPPSGDMLTLPSSDRYTPPSSAGVTKIGDRFRGPLPARPPSFINISQYDVTNFTFVTASSSNHFQESWDAVAGIQHMFPNHTIIYYDLGLESEQVKQAKRWCRVELRKFQFDKYAKHMRDLNTFAFKSTVVHDTVVEFGAVFWFDASIRQTHASWQNVYSTVRSTGGIAVLTTAYHNIYKVTHPNMYKYLPSDTDKLKRTTQLQATVFLVYNTQYIYDNVLYWWYLCGLTEDCIAPKGHKKICGIFWFLLGTTPVCHRYDQSSITILLSNLFAYNNNIYKPRDQPVSVARYPTNSFKLKNC